MRVARSAAGEGLISRRAREASIKESMGLPFQVTGGVLLARGSKDQWPW